MRENPMNLRPDELNECGRFRLVYTQKYLPPRQEELDDLYINGKAAKMYLPHSVGRECIQDNINNPWTSIHNPMYPSKLLDLCTLNYGKLSNYARVKTTQPNIKLGPYANQMIPYGPGSAISKFDLHLSSFEDGSSSLAAHMNSKAPDITGTFFSFPHQGNKMKIICPYNDQRTKSYFSKTKAKRSHSKISITEDLPPANWEHKGTMVLKLKNGGELLESGHFKLLYTQKLFPRHFEQKPDLCVHASKAKLHLAPRPQIESPYSVGYYTRKHVGHCESDDEADKLSLYNSRSLNYDKMSNYKKLFKENVKFHQSRPNGHNIPLGPGSIVSRFDINYSPSISALVTSREPLSVNNSESNQQKSPPTKPLNTAPHNNFNTPKIDIETIAMEVPQQSKIGQTVIPQSPQIQYRAPLPINLKVLAKKW